MWEAGYRGGNPKDAETKWTLNFQTMTSGYPEEDCSVDIEGYLDPNSFPPHQKEKQLDTIPEDESGYLLANHLPITQSDKVIQDDESKQVLVKDVSGNIVPTTNEIHNSKDSTEMEPDVSKEEVVANGLNHKPPTEESSGEVTEIQNSQRLVVADEEEGGL